MRLLWLCLFVIVGAAGCAGDGRYTWDDVLKDARGDNMQMRSGWGSKPPAASDDSSQSNSQSNANSNK